MSQSTTRIPSEQPLTGIDPFGLAYSLADVPGDWPPADPVELARLEAWMDQMEREHAERYGNGDPD